MNEIYGLIESNYGLIEGTMKEISNLLDTKKIKKINESLFIIRTNDIKNLFFINYFSKTVNRVSIIIDIENNLDFEGNKVSSFIKEIEANGKSFAVRKGYGIKSTYEVYKKIGDIIKQSTGLYVNLHEPDLIFRVYRVDKKYILTLDLTGETPLYKRCYKIREDINIMRPTVFSQLYYMFSIDKKTIIDTSRFGVFSIEATIIEKNIPAQICRTNLQMFKSFRIEWKKFVEDINRAIKEKIMKKIYYTYRSKKELDIHNSMASKVFVKDSVIKRKIDLRWFDSKFEENSIDSVFMDLTDSRMIKNKEYIDDSLFSINRVLSKNGILLILARRNTSEIVEMSMRNNFSVLNVKDIFSENSGYKVILLSHSN